MAAIVARISIWAFFLLIVTRSVEFFAQSHQSPIRPFQVYAVIIIAAFVAMILHAKEVGVETVKDSITRTELTFFAIIAALYLLIFASFGGHQEGSLRVAIWPLANLVMAAEMFYFARLMSLGCTIAAAAIAALGVELVGLDLDLWIPGVFAEWIARPAGFPQNSNNGALLVSLLLAFLLPNKLRMSPHAWMPFALVVALPLVFITLSRSGLIFYFLVTIFYVVTLILFVPYRLPKRSVSLIFAGVFIPCLLVTISFAPTLREPSTTAIWRSRLGFSVQDVLPSAVNTVSKNVAVRLKSLQLGVVNQAKIVAQASAMPQEILDESIDLADNTISLRAQAFRFFWNVGLQHPWLGAGTGYGYQFKTGPHNTFVALAADQGFPALILYLIALVLLTAVAAIRLAPLLLAIVAIVWIDSMLSHTVLVQPDFLILACAALGATKPDDAANFRSGLRAVLSGRRKDDYASQVDSAS